MTILLSAKNIQYGRRRHLGFEDIDCVSTVFKLQTSDLCMCKKWYFYHYFEVYSSDFSKVC